MNKKWKPGKRAFTGAAVVLLGSIIFGALRLGSDAAKFSTAEAKRKEFVDYLEVKGEVKALHSVIIAAPYGAGDLQIVELAPNGAKVKKGDVLVEFDNSTMKQKLAQDQSALKSAEAEIHQSGAAARLKEEQDLTDVMKAKFDAQKARLDAGKQEIVSVIEGEEAKLKLADAEQMVKQTEAKLNADRSAAAADLAEHRTFDGCVYFVFQPAEEGKGGAKRMIDEGLFNRFPMQAVFGMHNLPGVPVGTFSVRPGRVVAATKVKGRISITWVRAAGPWPMMMSSL